MPVPETPHEPPPQTTPLALGGAPFAGVPASTRHENEVLRWSVPEGTPILAPADGRVVGGKPKRMPCGDQTEPVLVPTIGFEPYPGLTWLIGFAGATPLEPRKGFVFAGEVIGTVEPTCGGWLEMRVWRDGEQIALSEGEVHFALPEPEAQRLRLP